MSDIVIGSGQPNNSNAEEGITVIKTAASVDELNDIKAETLAHKDEAEASAVAAALSESNASTSETNLSVAESNASNSASAALASEQASASSEASAISAATSSADSAATATIKANSATSSETAAASSETNALTSANSSSTSADSASDSASIATTQAGISTTQATASSASATASASSASAAAISAQEALDTANTITALEGLTDVDTVGKTDGDSLVYNATSGNWEAGSIVVPAPTISTTLTTIDENGSSTNNSLTGFNSDYEYVVTADNGTISNYNSSTGSFDYTAQDITGVVDETDTVRCSVTFGFFTNVSIPQDLVIKYVAVVADTAVTFSSTDIDTNEGFIYG